MASRTVVGDRPCNRCGGPLITTEKRLAKPDYTCKTCCAISLREWRAKNRERSREYWRTYISDEARRQRKRDSHNAYAKRNRHKINARFKVRNAIIAGKIVKAPCAHCGDPVTFAHHTDYSKPLDVVWLCMPCHRLEHVTAKRAA